jgi:hypothetical protein
MRNAHPTSVHILESGEYTEVLGNVHALLRAILPMRGRRLNLQLLLLLGPCVEALMIIFGMATMSYKFTMSRKFTVSHRFMMSHKLTMSHKL